MEPMLHSESASDRPVPSSPLLRCEVSRRTGVRSKRRRDRPIDEKLWVATTVLVNPSPDLWDEEAEPTATHGIELLRAARDQILCGGN